MTPPIEVSRRSLGSLCRRISALVALVIALITLGSPPPAAEAHAFLASSNPATGAILAVAPERVTLRFTEPLERSYSEASLFDRTGAPVEGATFGPGADEFSMDVVVPAGVANGTYSVLWRTLSTADGHTAEGFVTFTVGSQSDVAPLTLPARAAESSVPSWLPPLARWISLLGLAGCVAIWPLWLFVLRPAISPAWQAGPALARRMKRFAAASVGVAFGGSVLALLVQAASTAGDDGLIENLGPTLLDTRYGRMWVFRMEVLGFFAVGLLASAWWIPARRRWLTRGVLVLSALLPLPFSLVSHAAALANGRAAAVAIDLFHLLGASLWVGGLFVFVGVVLPTLRDLTPVGRRVVLVRALPRFSLVALISWAVLGGTGLYNAWLQVGNWEALRTTDYGRSLTLKVLLLVPILVLAAFNLLIVTRRLRRKQSEAASVTWGRRFGYAVAAEAALVVLVLLVVGRLIGQAPARDDLAQRDGRQTYELDGAGREATLTVAPAATGFNHFRLDVAGDRLPTDADAVIRIGLPSRGVGAQELTMTRGAGNGFEWHGSELALPGEWTIETVLRVPGEADWSASRTLLVGTDPPRVDLAAPAWRFNSTGVLGVVLAVLGVAGVVIAARAGQSPVRRESLGLGMVGLAVGALLLLQNRVDPALARIPSSNPVAPDAASITRGEQIFAAQCVACHGPGGQGDGPAGVGLDPAPANLTIPHSRAHLDQDFFYWIENGYPRSAMPTFGDDLSDQQIWDTINYVRSLQSAAAAAEAATPAPIAPDS